MQMFLADAPAAGDGTGGAGGVDGAGASNLALNERVSGREARIMIEK